MTVTYSTTQNYRADIDGLRAVAVISVLLFHAFPEQISGGFIGVDVFFVISGFLITRILLSQALVNQFSLLGFYRSRVRRIFPALVCVISFCVLLGWFVLFPAEYVQLGKHALGGVLFSANFINWSEAGYFNNLAETKPLLHLWSLGIEEQFYIAWPLLLAFLANNRRRLFITLCFSIALSLSAGVILTDRSPVAAFFSPVSRIWELLAGALLGVGAVQYGTQSNLTRGCRYEAQSLIGLSAIIVPAVLLSPTAKFPGVWALVPVVGTMLVISAGSSTWVNKNFLSSSPLIAVGLISYPLYLWHWPLLSFPRIIFGEQPPALIRALSLAVAFVLAAVTYYFLEKPIRFGRLRRRAVPVLVLSMMAAGVAGAYVYSGNGLPERGSIAGYSDNFEQLIRGPQKNRECIERFEKDDGRIDFCMYQNNGGTATVAIIGDSHAHASYPGLAEMLRERKTDALLLGNSGCPSLFEIGVGVDQVTKDQCRRKTGSIISALQSLPNLTHVFIVSRGPLYLSGHGVGEAGADVNGPPWVSDTEFLAGIQRTVDLLDKRGVAVAIVEENPEFPFFPNACIRRPFWNGKNNCVVSLDEVLKRQREYLDILARVKKAELLMVLPTLCSDSQCSVFGKDGSLLYADDDHLSVAGSRIQARMTLGPYLDRTSERARLCDIKPPLCRRPRD